MRSNDVVDIVLVEQAQQEQQQEETPQQLDKDHQQQQQQQQQEQQEDVAEATQKEPEEFLQDDFEDLEGDDGPLTRLLDSKLSGLKGQLSERLPLLKSLLLLLLCCGYAVYFGFAVACERLQTEGSVRLVAVTCLVAALAAGRLASRRFGHRLHAAVLRRPLQLWSQFRRRHPTAVAAAGAAAFVVYFLGFVIGIGVQHVRNLVSGLGVLVIVALSCLMSAYPTRVNWRPVMGGLTIQITLAFLLLRTQPGFEAFSFLGDRVQEFVAHVDAGASFVFGASFRDHFFAFAIMSVIVFFSSLISLLFHLGVLQALIQSLGSAMQLVMGTTPAESLVAAANVFIGMTEAPLLVRPFVGRMTNSELHSVISCGYATIAGAAMAAYIGMGVPARHLLTASVMVAPGALALSKILYPETKKSKTDSKSIRKIEVAKYQNSIDAIGSGAVAALPIVAAIAVNLISFITMLHFLNSTLVWLGNRACLGVDVTFQFLCGYVLWPIAFVLGIDPIDCNRVAELIGTKFFINEFVAYERFIDYRKNHEQFARLLLNSSEFVYNGVNVTFPELNATVTGGLLFHERSVAISTYALCGFANIGSVGMQLAAFSVLLPRRRSELVPLVLRGVVTGTLANLLTASIAGIFFLPGL